MFKVQLHVLAFCLHLAAVAAATAAAHRIEFAMNLLACQFLLLEQSREAAQMRPAPWAGLWMVAARRTLMIPKRAHRSASVFGRGCHHLCCVVSPSASASA